MKCVFFSWPCQFFFGGCNSLHFEGGTICIHFITVCQLASEAGDWKKGERGLAALPGRQEEFQRSLQQGAEYAQRRLVGMESFMGSSEKMLGAKFLVTMHRIEHVKLWIFKYLYYL